MLFVKVKAAELLVSLIRAYIKTLNWNLIFFKIENSPFLRILTIYLEIKELLNAKVMNVIICARDDGQH